MAADAITSARGPLLRMADLRIEAVGAEPGAALLHGLNLELNRGEILGLIGESGAGKSTAGLAAMGYARPGCRISGGSVIFDGADLLALPESSRRRLRGSRI